MTMPPAHLAPAAPAASFIAHLQRVAPQLALADAQRIASGMQPCQLPVRKVWLAAGQAAHSMAFVACGLLKAVYTTADGACANINFIAEGQMAGDYQAFAQGGPARYSYVCLQPCTLLCMSRTQLRDCAAQVPGFQALLRTELEAALFSYLRRTEGLLLADARSRYLDFVRQQPTLAARLSVSDLCSYLGIQRQTLTRIRRSLTRPAA